MTPVILHTSVVRLLHTLIAYPGSLASSRVSELIQKVRTLHAVFGEAGAQLVGGWQLAAATDSAISRQSDDAAGAVVVE